MLTIWGRVNSVNVQKALWCAEELSLVYERIDAGMEFGVVGSPQYLALNPNGRVPTINDDGFVLWESNAIVRYLAFKHGLGTLCPADIQQRADADRWMDWCTASLAGPFRIIYWGLIRTPPDRRDTAAIEQARTTFATLLDIVDKVLARRPFLAGARLTMGDIPLGCYLHRWLNMLIERPAHPHIEAWHRRLLARPAFDRIVNIPLS